MNFNDNDNPIFNISAILIIVLLILFLGLSIIVGHKMYVVWAESKMGQAEFARAEYNRQIKTLEAKAVMESAKHLADAEIIRAQGVAKANQIIGESLQQNEAYLRYLWIQNLNHNDQTIVYVPTEANLPIMEASRIKSKKEVNGKSNTEPIQVRTHR